MFGGVHLCSDLLFASRIDGHAHAAGLTVRTARNYDTLRNYVQAATPSCVMLDLHQEGLNIVEAVAFLKENGVPRIIGYGSHVDVKTLSAARAAGCDMVLPRSKFVEDLGRDLPLWLV